MKGLNILALAYLLGSALSARAQTDTLCFRQTNAKFIDRVTSSQAFRMTYIGVPLVTGGLIMKSEDNHFRNLRNDYLPRFNHHADDYLQYLPAAVMLGMKLGGVKGRSSWGRMLVSDAFSALLMGSVVYSLKQATHVMRPDGSNDHSFPSGHTATAFMTATMLAKEYGHKSPWIGIGAYSADTATGLMRMANNKHWLSDVLAGAGIGILSTELGYYLADLIFKGKGIHNHAVKKYLSEPYAPSFLGLYLGLNVMPGSYRLKGGSTLQFSSGSTTGLEGAYFFNPYVGIGGQWGISNVAVNRADKAQEQALDFTSLYAGAYLSYPIVPRLWVGGKFLAGYVHASSLYVSGKSVTQRNCAGFTTGVSLTVRMNSRLGMKLFADYELQPSLLRTNGNQPGHIVTVGGCASVLF